MVFSRAAVAGNNIQHMNNCNKSSLSYFFISIIFDCTQDFFFLPAQCADTAIVVHLHDTWEIQITALLWIWSELQNSDWATKRTRLFCKYTSDYDLRMQVQVRDTQSASLCPRNKHIKDESLTCSATTGLRVTEDTAEHFFPFVSTTKTLCDNIVLCTTLQFIHNNSPVITDDWNCGS